MAQYISQKRVREEAPSASSSSRGSREEEKEKEGEGEVQRKRSKPLYSGPTPPPNRFHIRPGYRWDAIDRGNGYESSLLKKLSDRNSLKEDEHRWAVSDM
jgi:hypothetical protein